MKWHKLGIIKCVNRFGFLAGIKIYLTIRFQLASSINIYERKIYLRKKTSDFHVFYQILIDQLYLIEQLPQKAEIIIDGGANIGLTSIFFSNIYSKATVFAIEPDVDNFNILKKNTFELPNIVAINKAIWGEHKKLNVVDDGHGEWGRVVREADEGQLNVVDAITINELLKAKRIRQIDILKMDVEGAESSIFEGDVAWLSITKLLIIEIHEDRFPNIGEKIRSILNDQGFRLAVSGENHIFYRQNN